MQTDFPRCSSAWAKILGRGAAPAGEASLAGVEGRCVLVTGAGGFIGAEMVRRLAASGAGRVVLLDAAEQPLFRIHAEMSAQGHGDCCVPVAGSVCDGGLLRDVFEQYRPELALHAAALKHVPLMERNPLAAVDTNALGTQRVAQAARAHGVRAMILVSTDKAVAPHSIMGAAKRIAELTMLAEAGRGGMRCAAVRLANVIGSPGSVGPLFAEQIARGGTVTVTHPEATRYFLTLEEVATVLGQAMESGAADRVLIPDPGEPVRIVDLAQRMMQAAEREAPITFVGLRPGDKLHERLVGAKEREAGPATRELRRVESPMPRDLDVRLRELEATVAARDLPAALRVVAELVPDYEPSAVLRVVAELVPDYEPSAVLRESLAEVARP